MTRANGWFGTKRNGAEIRCEKEDLAQSNPQLYEWLRIINAKSSKHNVSQKDADVNDQINEKTESISEIKSSERDSDCAEYDKPIL